MTLTSAFPKLISVFGVNIRGSATTSDEAMQHAAKIMGQYLDNDEDGVVDNSQVLQKMLENNAEMLITSTQQEQETLQNQFSFHDGQQDLYVSEMNLQGNGVGGRFDASLEEVLHLVTHTGYSKAYPDVFGETAGSAIANAMDTARGGHFTSVPSSYPSGAWYTYDDTTADYGTQITEYTYWALTSKLGGQNFNGRLEDIQHEWRPNTAEKLAATDSAVNTILSDAQYNLPTVLPDTTYNGKSFVVINDVDAANNVTGTDSDDNLSTGAGNDTVKGGAGDDILETGSGNDIVWAGSGDAGADTLSGADGNDALWGGAGDDSIMGGTNNDTIGGGTGNDTISGGDGDDILYASAGDDNISGGAGADNIWSGTGNDTISGGDGNDTFNFSADQGDDQITDFSVADDTLNLATTTTDFQSATDVLNAATAQNGGVMIDLGGGNSLFLDNINTSDISNINFIFEAVSPAPKYEGLVMRCNV